MTSRRMPPRSMHSTGSSDGELSVGIAAWQLPGQSKSQARRFLFSGLTTEVLGSDRLNQ